MLEEKDPYVVSSQMDLITLDMAYSVHMFVKDQERSKHPAVKRPIRFTENDRSFLEGVYSCPRSSTSSVYLLVFRIGVS